MKTFLIGYDNDPPIHILNLLKDRLVDFTDRDYYVEVNYTKIDAHLYVKISSYDPNIPISISFVENGVNNFSRPSHPNIKFDSSLIDSLIVATIDLINNGFELVSYTNCYVDSHKNAESLQRLENLNESQFTILFKDVANFNKKNTKKQWI